jgi:sugar lactone lactonase YvrE
MAHEFTGSVKGFSRAKDGKGNEAWFDQAKGLAIDRFDNIYVADRKTIRKITPASDVTTIAGNNTSARIDGIGLSASFTYPDNLAIDSFQNLYVTDREFDISRHTSYHTIRKISAQGAVTTLKNPDGTILKFNDAEGITCDSQGNILVTDMGSRCIKKITVQGTVVTVAGKCDLQKYNPTFREGSLTTAMLMTPGKILATKAGEYYFTDTRLHRVIRIANGRLTTIAGNGEIDLSHSNIGGYAEEGYQDGKAKQALFNGPEGIVMDKQGNMYIVDAGNRCIRKLSIDGMVSTFCK